MAMKTAEDKGGNYKKRICEEVRRSPHLHSSVWKSIQMCWSSVEYHKSVVMCRCWKHPY